MQVTAQTSSQLVRPELRARWLRKETPRPRHATRHRRHAPRRRPAGRRVRALGRVGAVAAARAAHHAELRPGRQAARRVADQRPGPSGPAQPPGGAAAGADARPGGQVLQQPGGAQGRARRSHRHLRVARARSPLLRRRRVQPARHLPPGQPAHVQRQRLVGGRGGVGRALRIERRRLVRRRPALRRVPSGGGGRRPGGGAQRRLSGAQRRGLDAVAGAGAGRARAGAWRARRAAPTPPPTCARAAPPHPLLPPPSSALRPHPPAPPAAGAGRAPRAAAGAAGAAGPAGARRCAAAREEPEQGRARVEAGDGPRRRRSG